MPRKRPEPFWRAERQCYFVQIGWKQHRLAPDEGEAWRLYHELMSRPPEPQRPETDRPLLVVEILDAFLSWCAANSTPRTYQWRKDMLETFARGIPRDLPVSQLKAFHVTRKMNAHPNWGNDTRANLARCVQRAFRWACRQGLIEQNPVEHVEKPPRGRSEDVYTREEYERLLARFPDREFRDVLVTAWETGCWPQELFAVEDRFVDHDGRRWLFPVSGSKGRRKPRIVYLSDAAYEVTARLCRAHPSGKLFCNRAGQPWDKDTVSRRFLLKKKRLGKKYCLYGFRHSFATRKLLEGVDPITVALLLGHSNLSMRANQYSHLMKNPEHLRKALSPDRDAGG